jgi:hypothetical protein
MEPLVMAMLSTEYANAWAGRQSVPSKAMRRALLYIVLPPLGMDRESALWAGAAWRSKAIVGIVVPRLLKAKSMPSWFVVFYQWLVLSDWYYEPDAVKNPDILASGGNHSPACHLLKRQRRCLTMQREQVGV